MINGAVLGPGETFGEMVFNTGMTGYQETLTDPSYCRQIVAMTAPHIGNTGVNDEDPESRQVWVSGYVVREPARLASSWRATSDLDTYLRAEGVTGIAVRGTRLLTRRVREQGAMRAAISTVETSPEKLLERVLASPEMTGADLAQVVSTPEPYTIPAEGAARHRVVAVDLGIKASTARNLAARACEVLVVPATTTAEQILAASPDGVFFSNGPGDPAAAGYAVDAMRGVLGAGVPVLDEIPPKSILPTRSSQSGIRMAVRVSPFGMVPRAMIHPRSVMKSASNRFKFVALDTKLFKSSMCPPSHRYACDTVIVLPSKNQL